MKKTCLIGINCAGDGLYYGVDQQWHSPETDVMPQPYIPTSMVSASVFKEEIVQVRFAPYPHKV